MIRRSLALTIAAALAAVPLVAGAAGDPQDGHVFALEAQNGSGEYGTFAIKPHGERTTIEIHLLGAPEDVAQPAHIHLGTCGHLNPAPAYALKTLVDGISETSVPITAGKLIRGGFAVNVHKSATEANVYVACGNIVR